MINFNQRSRNYPPPTLVSPGVYTREKDTSGLICNGTTTAYNSYVTPSTTLSGMFGSSTLSFGNGTGAFIGRSNDGNVNLGGGYSLVGNGTSNTVNMSKGLSNYATIINGISNSFSGSQAKNSKSNNKLTSGY